MSKNGFGRVVLISSSSQQLKILKNAFYQYNKTDCICQKSALAAVSELEKQSRVDVIILDWLGMDMDVFDFLSQIREMSSCVNSCVILCGPGNMKMDIRESLLSIGVDYYMIKPYKTDTLFHWIEALRQKGHLPTCTIWDAHILRKLEKKGLTQADVGYWYIGSSLQLWMTCDGIPQLKSIFMQVGEHFNVSDKGVESGVNRAIRTLSKAEGLTRMPKCKEWISSMAESIWLEVNEIDQGVDHGDEEV